MIVVPSRVMIESCWHADCGWAAGDASGLAIGPDNGSEVARAGCVPGTGEGATEVLTVGEAPGLCPKPAVLAGFCPNPAVLTRLCPNRAGLALGGSEALALVEGEVPAVAGSALTTGAGVWVSGPWSTRDTTWRLWASRAPPPDRRSSNRTPTCTPGPFPVQSKASVCSSPVHDSDRASSGPKPIVPSADQVRTAPVASE